MKLLLLNPNMSAGMTEAMAGVVARYASPETEILPFTASRGFPYISSRSEADIAATIVLEAIAERQAEVDAVIIAAFGDPGLVAARELFDMPVVGMAEAAMLTACALGQRFAIVTFSPALAAWYRDGVDRARLEARFAGIRTPERGFSSVGRVQEELGDELVRLAERAAVEDGADVAILAGAPLAGLAGLVAPRLPIPVVEPIAAALLQAEALVRLAPTKARIGAFARPPAKPATGLAPALARRIARED
jgi:allantoin racemase